MKNLFTVVKKSAQVDGDKNIICPAIAFIDRKPETDRAEKNKELRAQVGRLQKALRLPPAVSVIGFLALMSALICLSGFVGALDEKSAAEIIAKNKWLLPVMISSACIAAAVFVAQKIRERSVSRSGEAGYVLERVETQVKEGLEALGVPADAPEVDVMVTCLSQKQFEKGKNPFGRTQVNFAVKMFTEGEAICFATIDCVVKIPFEKITAVNLVNKRIAAAGWNKDVAYNKGQYKRYKIRSSNGGFVWIKPYYRVELRDGAEEYAVLLPCYDIEPFLQMTGKTVA